jgi:uncharacterized membrane protein
MGFLHPIIVHFPIALLTVYAVLELVRFKKVTSQPYWFYVKAVLVILGSLGSLAAFMTGPEGDGALPPIVAMHARFATTTVILFLIISMSYLLTWCKPTRVTSFVLRPYIIIPLALAGLVCITITGGLGGAIVYGTHFDPFMAPIFKLLGVY